MFPFNRKPKRLPPMDMPSLDTILVIDNEPLESIVKSFKSSLLVGRALSNWVSESYAILEGEIGPGLHRYGIQTIISPGRPDETQLSNYCKEKHITLYHPEAAAGTKASNLATVVPRLSVVNLLLDVGVELKLDDAGAIVNSLSEFVRNDKLGMLLGKKRRGALLRDEYIVQALGGGGITYSLELKRSMGDNFDALLTLFMERKGNYKVKQIKYIKSL